MRAALREAVERLQAQSWVIPGVLVAACFGLLMAARTIALPEGHWAAPFVINSAPAESARAILSSIATSVMTVVGVLFSVTIVVLQLVSSQYTPRVIQNFIRSGATQTVLGVYIGTFLYCVLLLGSLGPSLEARRLAVPLTIAVALSLLCLVLLMFYIHRLTDALRSTSILGMMRNEAVRSIDRVVRDSGGLTADTAPAVGGQDDRIVIHAVRHGYVQRVAWEEAAAALKKHPSAIVRFNVTAGEFVQEGGAVAYVWRAGALPERHVRKLRNAVVIGAYRTHAQDPEFGIRQMSDVALRALSPGINDPTTAIEALNDIGVVLRHVTRSYFPVTSFRTPGGARIALVPFSYEDFVRAGLAQILLSASGHPFVLETMARLVGTCRGDCRPGERGQVLNRLQEEIVAVIKNSRELGPYQGSVERAARRRSPGGGFNTGD